MKKFWTINVGCPIINTEFVWITNKRKKENRRKSPRILSDHIWRPFLDLFNLLVFKLQLSIKLLYRFDCFLWFNFWNFFLFSILIYLISLYFITFWFSFVYYHPMLTSLAAVWISSLLIPDIPLSYLLVFVVCCFHRNTLPKDWNTHTYINNICM